MIIQFFILFGLGLFPLFYLAPVDFAPYSIISLPSLLLFLSTSKWTKCLVTIVNLFFIFALTLEAFHLLIYETVSTPGVYLALFETDWGEVKEFMEGQSLLPLIWVSALIGVMGLVAQKFKIPFTKRAALLSSVFVLTLVFFQLDKLISSSPLKLISYYRTYLKEKQDFKERFELRPQAPIVVTKDFNLQDNTVVFILGESTTRNRMSLYGYPRETTPNLKKINSLLAFKNVVSPHTQTYKSLKKTLTLLNHENEKKLQDNIHIINLARASGYRTYWISNQKSLGKFENPHSIVAKAAHEVHWLSQFDQLAIKALERVLQKDHKKKFVVIHLMGAHAHYKYRYPESFNQFKTGPPVPNFITTQSEHELYNEYDNAILYQDFVLSSLREMIRKYENNYSLIYFPDHGEEVFQSGHLFGHNEAAATANMYEIPLLFESTFPSLQKIANLNQLKAWSIEDFIHPLHSLLGVKTKYYEGKRDFLNEEFANLK